MEIRVLEYYISIVNHKSITRAAEALHISQSTLSRQIMDMEDRLGVTLFERGRREISLTEDGDFLYQRAKDIVQLASDTEKKILAGKSLSGTIRIGIGEGSVNDLILSAVWPLIERNPDVVLDYQTLAADKIFRDIDMGLLDFGVVWTNDNLSRYEFLELPYENYWGAVIKSDDPLADKEDFVAADLRHRSLILPQQLDVISDLKKYLSNYVAGVRVTGYYDMNYNMIAMVKAGIGTALTLDKPEYAAMTDISFKPLKALKPIEVKLIWKAENRLTRLCQAFLSSVDERAEKERTRE
jgi:DNA-binding transcriptional LysR family regulator